MVLSSPPAITPWHTPSDALLRLIADSVPALMAYFDLPERRCRFANQSYAAYNGHSIDSILGLTVAEAIGPKAWKDIQPHVERCMQGEQVKYQREQTLPGNQQRVIEVNLIPHFAEDRQMVGAFVLITDITDHWRAERAVRQSEQRMRKFAAATEEALVFHRNGVIIDGNDALERLLGYPVSDVLGQSIFSFIDTEWRAVALEYTRQGREDPYEVLLIHKDGHQIPVEVVGKTMPLHQGDYRVVVVHDIRARKQAQAREAFIALHDPLTQLPNRRHLMEQLERLLEKNQKQQQQAALLFIDLDHFKTVNDSLGHHAGDQLLCEVSTRLHQCLRDSDLIARLGGDEFVVVLPTIHTPADASLVATKLLDAMQPSFTLDGQPVAVSASIGISLFPQHGTSSEALLRCADDAMYHVKESGRANHQLYQPGMDGSATQVLQQERQLRQAIADNAFVLHYQPQINNDDGRLQGFEALVRWQHPERGLVGPGEFIPFAEARGLIVPIGRWVLHEACRQLKAWLDEGLAPVSVAINLSAIEFHQRDLLTEITQVLCHTGLPAHCLEIELTESVLMHHNSKISDCLQQLRALGIRVAIDDFGTGYSSLAYLKRYPIQKLKIDRSFVMDTPDDPDSVAIVTAMVQMGRSLQIEVLAEGVETVAQMQLLRQLGCTLVQGYLVARPMDAQQTRHWLMR